MAEDIRAIHFFARWWIEDDADFEWRLYFVINCLHACR
jgi:hypothetical protein